MSAGDLTYRTYRNKLNASQRRRRNARVAAGLCRDCLQPQVPGKVTCVKHTYYRKVAKDEYRERVKLRAASDADGKAAE